MSIKLSIRGDIFAHPTASNAGVLVSVISVLKKEDCGSRSASQFIHFTDVSVWFFSLWTSSGVFEHSVKCINCTPEQERLAGCSFPNRRVIVNQYT